MQEATTTCCKFKEGHKGLLLEEPLATFSHQPRELDISFLIPTLQDFLILVEGVEMTQKWQ
jgi:hypothetical protein